MALRILPYVPTYGRVEYFANPPTWLTSPLPCLVTMNRQMMRTWIFLQIFWILSKYWADLHLEEQLSLSMMQLSGMFTTVSSISLRTCVANVGSCFFCHQIHMGGNLKFYREVLPCQNARWWLHGTNAIIVARILLDGSLRLSLKSMSMNKLPNIALK